MPRKAKTRKIITLPFLPDPESIPDGTRVELEIAPVFRGPATRSAIEKLQREDRGKVTDETRRITKELNTNSSWAIRGRELKAAARLRTQSAPKSIAQSSRAEALPAGEWLMPPQSLKTMANAMAHITTRKAKDNLKPYGLRNWPTNNRQSWTVNLSPPMPTTTATQLRSLMK